MLGVRVVPLQEVKRSRGIRQFANALVVFALASADASEIETQHRKSHVEETIVQIVHDFVVHRSAVTRVRMQNDSDR